MEVIIKIWEMLKGRTPEERARIVAYLLAPLLVAAGTIFALGWSSFAAGLEKPVAISELRTELANNGDLKPKKGVALIIQPTESEYRIPITGASRIWSSLDEDDARVNNDRLAIDKSGFRSKTPLLGINGPVAVVVEGELGNWIKVPGDTEPIDEWRSRSQRSNSLVLSVIAVCVFAFGISLATGFPSTRSDEHAAG